MDYAECPVCHTDRPIKKDGMLMKHRDTYNFAYGFPMGYPICKGSGQKPVETAEEDIYTIDPDKIVPVDLPATLIPYA